MQLKELFAQLTSQGFSVSEDMASHPSWTQAVTGLSTNSQTIRKGDLFIGMPGTRVDGGDFWLSAIAKGAIAVLISPQALANKPNADGALVFTDDDIPTLCAELAASFYGEPAKAMNMVGVFLWLRSVITMRHFLHSTQTALKCFIPRIVSGCCKTNCHGLNMSAML